MNQKNLLKLKWKIKSKFKKFHISETKEKENEKIKRNSKYFKFQENAKNKKPKTK